MTAQLTPGNGIVDHNATGAIEIPLSRGKLTLLFVGALAFVAGGVLIWFKPDLNDEDSIVVTRAIAAASILFFGACAVVAGLKLFDGRPGLVIDQAGIVDHSSAVAVGRIDWSDVTELVINKVSGQRMLTVMVANHQKYLSRGSWWQRPLQMANVRITGSPVNISAASLAIHLDDLVQLLNEAHRVRRRKAKSAA